MMRSKISSGSGLIAGGVRGSKRPLGCVEKGGQQSIFTLGQRDLVPLGSVRRGCVDRAAAPEFISTTVWIIPLQRGRAGLWQAQHARITPEVPEG